MGEYDAKVMVLKEKSHNMSIISRIKQTLPTKQDTGKMIFQKFDKFLHKLTGSGDKISEYKTRYFRMFIITVVLLILPTFLPEIVVGTDNIYYLLSSISQGLAAVFALVISISLILTQLVFADMREKKERLRYLELEFQPLTVFFYIFFIFSIVFPLWLLALNNFDSLYIKSSLSFATICLYGTIEFALGFKQKITLLNKK
ncbi:MAG: hypothetical protein O8C63_08995 [Candidatus Methanoperedens sp.]|nr:hypothetical protein [Candidatus Methanoperedens sp.]